MTRMMDRRALLAGVGAVAGASLAAPMLAAAEGARQSNRGARSPGPVVKTANGAVRGYRANGVHVFRGLRYAAPTGGTNRFKPPAKPTPWAGVMEAMIDRPSAPQQPDPPSALGAGNSDRPTSEDCLFINLFTPAVNNGGKRPVMVWIHGGGYSKGAGTAPGFDGSNLARENDVVVVTLNHRLNAFGHLYLADLLGPAYADSGNVALLDIVAVLEWVRDNIAQFGGDPHNVTLFGQSSGGSKISALMAMPAATGLYHKAIIESGATLKVRTLDAAIRATDKALRILGLTRANAENLLTLPTEAFLPFGGMIGNVGSGPVVDGRSLRRQPFEPDAPPTAAEIPLLIGSTETEMTVSAQPADFALTMDGLRARMAPQLGDKLDAILDTYRTGRPGATPSELYFFLTADLRTTKPTHLQAERQALQNGGAVYLYRMAWRTPVAGGRLMSPHGIELPFVWNNLDAARGLVGHGPELQPMATRMSRMWAAFARSGDPNIPEHIHWDRFTPGARATMVFDVDDRLISDPYRAEREALLTAPPGPFG
ncbi:MAG: carboxylesterase/lipase family protein [Sphingobium sp.]|nr:carboxylesterase/lipase family protein [Sphingobium sp.]